MGPILVAGERESRPMLYVNHCMPVYVNDTRQCHMDSPGPTPKVPAFDEHLSESNTDLRTCSMEYTPRRKLTRKFNLGDRFDR